MENKDTIPSGFIIGIFTITEYIFHRCTPHSFQLFCFIIIDKHLAYDIACYTQWSHSGVFVNAYSDDKSFNVIFLLIMLQIMGCITWPDPVLVRPSVRPSVCLAHIHSHNKLTGCDISIFNVLDLRMFYINHDYRHKHFSPFLIACMWSYFIPTSIWGPNQVWAAATNSIAIHDHT